MNTVTYNGMYQTISSGINCAYKETINTYSVTYLL